MESMSMKVIATKLLSRGILPNAHLGSNILECRVWVEAGGIREGRPRQVEQAHQTLLDQGVAVYDVAKENAVIGTPQGEAYPVGAPFVETDVVGLPWQVVCKHLCLPFLGTAQVKPG